MPRIAAFIMCLLLLCSSVVLAEPVAVRPSDTDSRIATTDEPHYCWAPAGQARGSLVVFLTGTGGKPKDHFRFAEVAADLGYHVVSLMYPDELAAQQVAADSRDPQAHMKFRLAIIEGGTIQLPRGTRVIDPADSIQNRLDKLLVYLNARYPDQHWDQFVGADGQPVWEKIVVAGISQGGGHAYVLAKLHPVERVLMFASPKDYSQYFNRPASGFDADTKTPLDRFFAFNHMRDNDNGCMLKQQAEIFAQMTLTRLGVAKVEDDTAPYQHAHLLYTNANIFNGKFHSSVLRHDYSAVWRYMLTEPAP